jgi:hypothetical protein
MIHDLSTQKGRNTYIQSDEEKFISKFGKTDKAVFTEHEFRGSVDAKCEMAINFGYVWLSEHKVWVDKDSAMTKKEEKIFDRLREE